MQNCEIDECAEPILTPQVPPPDPTNCTAVTVVDTLPTTGQGGVLYVTTAGSAYVWYDDAWLPVSSGGGGGGGIPEAPVDGKLYARSNGGWVAFTIPPDLSSAVAALTNDIDDLQEQIDNIVSSESAHKVKVYIGTDIVDKTITISGVNLAVDNEPIVTRAGYRLAPTIDYTFIISQNQLVIALADNLEDDDNVVVDYWIKL